MSVLSQVTVESLQPPLVDHKSPENYREFFPSPSRGIYSPINQTAGNAGSQGPIPMNTAYRMVESGGHELSLPATSTLKQARNKAATSSVYEVNYEISV